MTSYELKQAQHLAKVSKRAEELVAELIDLTNDMNNETQKAVSNAIACGLLKQHRTLQQSFIGNFKNAMVTYGQTQTDPRNESAVKWAKQAGDLEVYFPYI